MPTAIQSQQQVKLRSLVKSYNENKEYYEQQLKRLNNWQKRQLWRELFDMGASYFRLRQKDQWSKYYQNFRLHLLCSPQWFTEVNDDDILKANRPADHHLLALVVLYRAAQNEPVRTTLLNHLNQCVQQGASAKQLKEQIGQLVSECDLPEHLTEITNVTKSGASYWLDIVKNHRQPYHIEQSIVLAHPSLRRKLYHIIDSRLKSTYMSEGSRNEQNDAIQNIAKQHPEFERLLEAQRNVANPPINTPSNTEAPQAKKGGPDYSAYTLVAMGTYVVASMLFGPPLSSLRKSFLLTSTGTNALALCFHFRHRITQTFTHSANVASCSKRKS